MTGESGIIYEIKNLVKDYENESEKLNILNGLNFKVQREKAICITGPSGSGKTTLLHLMGALDRPGSGKILYRGQDLGRFTDDQLAFFRRDKLGFIFQFHYLLGEFNVLENISMPARIAGKPKKIFLEKAEILADTLGLKERLSHYPSQLSGGERQRVAVARALINDPEIILADEPVGNLDRKNALLIRDLFFELQKKFRLTLIVVSHDLFFSESFPTIFQLEDGKIKLN